ncbi:ATP-binding protein [Pelotomaculum schinkii]|uniref:ATP-binding protein n=1 Tax=Pelotomaculum schinkii TaxID=78350 RepID=UPI00167DEDD2|nr:ATP-binding protein [Pelotomaculum schinkii]
MQIIDFPAKGVKDNLIFTKNSVFALYRFGSVSYWHLADEAKKQYVYAFHNVLRNFSGRGQIIYLSEELNVSANEYVDGVPLSPAPELREEARRHVDSAVNFLAYARAQRRRSYLCLQLPVAQAEFYTLHDVRDQFLEWFTALRKSALVTQKSVQSAKVAESEMYNAISNEMELTRAELEDFEFIVRRVVERYGPLPRNVPDRSEVSLSPGVLTALTAGAFLDAKLRYLISDVNDKKIYQTFITFADVPRYLPVVGREWLATIDRTCEFPVDAVVHFEVIRPEAAKKKVSAKKGMLKEQLEEHLAGQGEAPRAQEWAATVAGDLEAKIDDGMPLIRFGVVLAVAGRDIREMRSYTDVIFQKFGHGIKVCTPPGDMLKCLYMFFPGAEFHKSLPGIHADPGYVASSVPMAGTEVGDEKGLLLGFSNNSPVLFMPGLAMQKGSGAVAITGTQGGGKSMLGKTILHYCMLCGAIGFGVDPKDELKAFKDLPFSMKKVDFSPGGSFRLNPFTFSPDPRRAETIAKDFLGILLEAHKDDMAARRLIISHAVQKVMSGDRRDMYVFLECLDEMAGKIPGGSMEEEEIKEARVCSRLARLIESSALGQMIFGRDVSGSRLETREQLTIFNLKELPLPKVNDTPTIYDHVTDSEKIAVALLFLVASAAREAMFRVSIEALKVLYLDEVYHLLRVPAGYRLVMDILRMCRSLNIIPILMTQNPSDLDESIRNNLGYAFAFRMKARDEAANARKLLGLPALENEALENEKEMDAFFEEMNSLPEGHCFMRDMKNRVAEVEITPQPGYLLDIFDTRPGKGVFAECV